MQPTDNDSCDSSRNRRFTSTLTRNITSGPLKTKMNVEVNEGQDQRLAAVTVRENATVSEADKTMRNQHDRCSMSHLQQAEQLATPVMQGGGIDTTVVNKHDIDECCVTNKRVCSKQDSRQTSNQWLSNTFSMITSGILGKSKNATGKDSKENVEANSTKLIFKPEFNFFL